MPASGTPGLRIIFAGTPDFSVPALAGLIASGRKPLAVLTQPDRPTGRGRKILASPVKQCAVEHRIPVFQPETLNNAEIRKDLGNLKPDLVIVVAYGLILPQAILDFPRFGCWNIHASLLPRWRGAAPVQRVIEAGDLKTGVCIMQMEAGLDTGPVYHRREVTIDPAETGGSLHDKLSELGAQAVLHCIDQLERGALPEPVAQDDAKATYARKLNKSEAYIDWSEPALQIDRRVRAFNPWPVAWCELNGERLRIWRAAVADELSVTRPGQVLAAGSKGIEIATGQGVLRLLEVQRPGGRRMPVAEYLKAHPVLARILHEGGPANYQNSSDSEAYD